MADGEQEPLTYDDDIAGDIRSAFDTLKTDDPPPEVTALVEAQPETTEAEAGPARDERGRFASKTPEQAPDLKSAATPEPEAQQPASAETAPVTPPRHWKPEAKAAFLALTPELQKQVIEQQQAFDKEAEEFKPQAQRLKDYDALIAPHKERWALAGVSETQAMQQLLAASDYLERDPVNAIAYLMQQYGVTPQHFGVQPGQPQQQQARQSDPLAQQVQQITRYLQSQQQEQDQRVEREVQTEIEKFAADPKNIYFDNVSEDMRVFLLSKRANTLEEAYDMAIWARPDLRKLVTAAERAEEAKKQAAANQQKVDAARRASVSVTGSPGAGKPAPSQSSSGPDDIRADVLRARDQLRQQV